MLFGSDEHKARFLPRILDDSERWCQGFSEPDAGSDLANVKTRAELNGDTWVINGQKLWTSQATTADWIFLLVRTEETTPKHRGLSFLLCPLDQPGVTISPIRNITGGREFNEIFFDNARTAADLVVGGIGNGFKVAMATLGFERGTAFMSAQERFTLEYWRLVDEARQRGVLADAVMRDRLAQAYVGLTLMRLSGYRTVTAFLQGRNPGPESSTGKLQWSTWHQRLGELAMDILGADAMVIGPDYRPGPFQESFLFSRAHTIYAGASEIQRNIIGERVLGLPREPDKT
jgi:alkylation response protein AidB-like acyl-CoA dehydrogenase